LAFAFGLNLSIARWDGRWWDGFLFLILLSLVLPISHLQPSHSSSFDRLGSVINNIVSPAIGKMVDDEMVKIAYIWDDQLTIISLFSHLFQELILLYGSQPSYVGERWWNEMDDKMMVDCEIVDGSWLIGESFQLELCLILISSSTISSSTISSLMVDCLFSVVFYYIQLIRKQIEIWQETKWDDEMVDGWWDGGRWW